jgi:predicted nuclease of restriction endonuclease-like (RecB) superfamily
MPIQALELSPNYSTPLASLQERIRSAQTQAALSVNRELVLLYWQIGREILIQQDAQGWGARVIDRLSQDLSQAFPGMKGFSARNLKYMRAFAEAWPDEQFVQQVVAQLPWGHNVRLLDRITDHVEREWYARKAIENGWSRNILVHQIDTNLRQRLGAGQSNFERTLPAPQSELAQRLLKDPCTFDPRQIHPGHDAPKRWHGRRCTAHRRQGRPAHAAVR